MSAVAGQRVPRHAARIVAVWLVLSAVAVPLIVLVLVRQVNPGYLAMFDTPAGQSLLALSLVLLHGECPLPVLQRGQSTRH